MSPQVVAVGLVILAALLSALSSARADNDRDTIWRGNTLVPKVHLETGRGRLSVTLSRMRPYAVALPALIGSDNTFLGASKRASTQHLGHQQ